MIIDSLGKNSPHGVANVSKSDKESESALIM